MSEDEKSGEPGGFSSIAPMIAFATAMHRNWLAMASLGGFPSDNDERRTESSEAWKETVEARMRAMTSSWKSFSDAMMGSVDAAWEGQDKAAKEISEQMASAIRDFTGMDPREMMAGTGGEWSPQQVAFQSFGLGDSEAAAIAAEMVELATASSEAARTMFDLYRVVGDAWMSAAHAFAEANIESEADLADPKIQQRQWAATAEPILQKALASDAFVKANADFIRAASRQSKARSVFARRFTDLIEAPSRQEMTETYEAIQELRREVRKLRRNQKHLERALASGLDAPAKTE